MFSGEALAHWSPAALGEVLQRVGYVESNFAEREGGRVLRAKEDRDGLPIVLQLFANGESIAREDAERLLGPALPGLLELGVLKEERDSISSEVRLEPDGESWLVADHPVRILENPGHVMGIGRSTRLLATLAPVREGIEALDLCTGSGWIAKNLAARGARVTACDINPRAISFARLGARISGHEGIEFHCGNLFEPIADRQFDLITANPPFVISPDAGFTYRDSGQSGSSFCEGIVRAMPGHLKRGGTGVMLLSWFDDGADEASGEPLEWIDDETCGVWLFRNLTQDPDHYARKWLRDTSAGRVPVESEVRRWVDHFKSINARRIHTGFLVIHRHGGPRWSRHDIRQLDRLPFDAAHDLARVLSGESWLATQDPDEGDLLSQAYRTPEGIRTETASVLDGSWRALAIRLRSPAGLSYDGPVDRFLLDLLAHCHTEGVPEDWVDLLRGQPEVSSDPEELPSRVAGLIRELVRHGLLIPEGLDQEPA